MKKKYILVTGGAGYIGSKVVFDLIDKKHNVIVIDNLSTGKKKLISNKVIFIKEDLKNYDKLKTKLKKYKKNISIVMHFAASLSVEESTKNPLKYYLNNVVNTENLLKVSLDLEIKKFIFSSTCAVYGDIAKIKVSENTPTIPISNYGKTKLFSENLIKEYSKKYNFKYAILRYFNVVGADNKLRSGQISGKTLFKALSFNIIRKKIFKINLYGKNYNTKDGTCIRDYIDVNDLSELHLLSMQKLNNAKSFILNCGYNKGYTVKEVIYGFEKITKNKIKINYKKRRSGDMEALFCDNEKLKKMFPKWKRKYSILESISNALNWEKSFA